MAVNLTEHILAPVLALCFSSAADVEALRVIAIELCERGAGVEKIDGRHPSEIIDGSRFAG